MRVYADNAATTYMSETAMNTLMDCLKNYNSNPNSLHTEGQITAEKLAESREKVAKAINAANPNEIYFTSGGSEADNQALLSAARVLKDKGKKHLVSLNIEHHAILHTLKKLEKEGFEVTLLAPESNGIVDVNKVRDAIREDTALVSIMFANNEMGAIQPIPEIGAICKEKGVLFHTDAVQAAAHLPIDVQAMNIDMLSMSAHKFHGPKGIGLLYLRKGVRLERLIVGGHQESGMRAGTTNTPGIIGMAKALEISYRDMEKNNSHMKYLRDYFIDRVSKEIPYCKLNGGTEHRLVNNANFSFDFIEGESILMNLDLNGIAVSSGSACSSGSLEPSYVILSLGAKMEEAHSSIRFSLGKDTTKEEIDYTIEKLKETVARLRSWSPLFKEIKGEDKYV